MTDPMTLTAEFRSSEWELVLKYEDGSLPATVVVAWSPATICLLEFTERGKPDICGPGVFDR